MAVGRIGYTGKVRASQSMWAWKWKWKWKWQLGKIFEIEYFIGKRIIVRSSARWNTNLPHL